MKMLRTRDLLAWPATIGMGLLLACSSEPTETPAAQTAPLTTGPTAAPDLDNAPEGHVEGSVAFDGNVTRGNVATSGSTVVAFDPSAPSALPRKPAAKEGPRNKISPALAARLRPSDAKATSEVVVSVAHDTRFSALPKLLRGQPRTSPSNVQVLAARAAAIDAVDARRKPFRDGISMRARGLGAVVSEELPMGNSLVMTIPDAAVAALANEPDVLQIVPRFDGSPPPADANISNGTSLSTGMNSDFWRPWNDGSLSYFYMALFDTGVRSTHDVFTAFDSGVLGLHRDCSNTTNSLCYNSPNNDLYNDQDPYWEHGTATANIIMGGNSPVSGFGLPFRGVSKATLDYLNVYGLYSADAAAVSRAFYVATYVWGDDVIIAELQMSGDERSAASLAADDAFDQGVAVIAAQGNYNQVTAPGVPGAAQKAMAVGDYDAVNGATVAQFTGFTLDGRFKPDFQAPTNVDAASGMGDYYIKYNYNGTSGATAFAGGAAAIMYQWYVSLGGATNKPGVLYSALLAQGNEGNQPGSNGHGTGPLKLRSGSQWRFSWVSLGTSQVNVTWALPAGRKNLKVAIWWPEAQTDAHNDVDLAVNNPSGQEIARSQWGSSVWEKVDVPGTLAAGNYTIKVIPFSMKRTPQTVYFTAIADYQ